MDILFVFLIYLISTFSTGPSWKRVRNRASLLSKSLTQNQPFLRQKLNTPISPPPPPPPSPPTPNRPPPDIPALISCTVNTPAGETERDETRQRSSQVSVTSTAVTTLHTGLWLMKLTTSGSLLHLPYSGVYGQPLVSRGKDVSLTRVNRRCIFDVSKEKM